MNGDTDLLRAIVQSSTVLRAACAKAAEQSGPAAAKDFAKRMVTYHDRMIAYASHALTHLPKDPAERKRALSEHLDALEHLQDYEDPSQDI
jgi:hypothetical protein